jgi:aspartyl protease family protein
MMFGNLLRCLLVIGVLLIGVHHFEDGASWLRRPETVVATTAGRAASAGPASDDFGGGRTLRIRADRSGHFLLDADVDGTTVRFLVDTGASDVVLTPEDGERLGLRLRDRDFTLNYRTAGGVVRAAPIELRAIRIGTLTVRDVPAAINSQSIGVSLLGISFLKRLDGYAVERDSLVLRW